MELLPNDIALELEQPIYSADGLALHVFALTMIVRTQRDEIIELRRQVECLEQQL